MQKQEIKALIGFLFVVLSLLIVSPLGLSKGLVITNISTSTISKQVNSTALLGFDLLNSEAYSFYNVSFENDSVIYFVPIDTFGAGQVARINAVVRGDIPGNYNIKIKGFYDATVGASNITYNSNVDYNTGISLCDFTAVKGDKLLFNNLVADDIVMRNAITGNDITTILQNNTYLLNLDTPFTLKYYFLRRGFQFTNTCTITVLSDTGKVNNPELDAQLNFSLSIYYNPTNITYMLTERNYSINAFSSQDGVLTVTNTGVEVARNITLRADWTSFSPNSFDLNPGQTKGIIYTIAPTLSSTGETNQTYLKTLSITGNFASVNDTFRIFVPYAMIGNVSNTTYQSIFTLLTNYCREHPNETFCPQNPQIVYLGNSSDGLFNVTYSQEQMRKIWEYIFQLGDKSDVSDAYIKQTLQAISENYSVQSNYLYNFSNRLEELEKERQNSNSTNTFLVVGGMFAVVISLGGFAYFLIKRNKSAKKYEAWG